MLMVVMVVAVITFVFLGRPDFWLRMASRIVLVPAIAAVSYEIIRFNAAHSANVLSRMIIAPGLALQKLTTRKPDEMVVAMTIAKPAPGTESLFLKLGARSYLVISIVMIALVIEPDGDRVGSARIAVGACATVPRRLPALEAALEGARLDDRLGGLAEASHLTPALDPIDDIRGSAAYRMDAALTLLRRGLGELGARL